MLSGISRKHSIRSNPCWFTEFCNSQRLSHFAAPFIVVRAEASVAESCYSQKHIHAESNLQGTQDQRPTPGQGRAMKQDPTHWCPEPPAEGIDAISFPCQVLTWKVHNDLFWMRVNDPSAGSPTETLLRLLLPLSDKVH